MFSIIEILIYDLFTYFEKPRMYLEWKTTAGIYNQRSDWAYNFSCFCVKFFTKPFGGKRSVVFTAFQLLLWFMCEKTFRTWLTITHSVLAFRIYIFLYVAEFTLSENSVIVEQNGESFFTFDKFHSSFKNN